MFYHITHSLKVSMWCAVIMQVVNEPFFLKGHAGGTATVESNLKALHFLWHTLKTNWALLGRSQFMQQDTETINTRPTGGGQNLPPPVFFRVTPKPLQISTWNLVHFILHRFDIEWPSLVEIGRKFFRNWRFCGVTSRQFWPKSAQY